MCCSLRALIASVLFGALGCFAGGPAPAGRPGLQDGARHWAFVAPSRVRPAEADPGLASRPSNPVDAFVQSRLRERGMTPANPADPETLLRRLTLDLTGLPPTPEELEAFRSDRQPGAYEREVDRLLASPRFGERMAQDWLDAARFADSNGYQVDRDREMWAWRDWVIAAFNRNLPFDQFTVEQLAGDLLPNPTFEQRVATGFHRNHMINEEGGIIPEEFLAEYCADRVETTGTVWLGLTFQCARCHDHKHDPVTQRDFYSLLAFFHNVSEKGVGDYGAPYRRSSPPFLELPAPEMEARLASLRQELVSVTNELAGVDARLTATLADWEQRGIPINPAPADEVLAALRKPANQRDAAELERIRQFRLKTDPERAALAARVAALEKGITDIGNTRPVTLVMAEMETPRPTFILKRGAYDRPGDPVTPDTPSALLPFGDRYPRNRLGLARWLVDPANPLTARVTVNRFWQTVFGQGLVRTPGDFGTQGEPPTHPELLDWLARWFVDSGWDVKALMRLLVTSATYRQDSRCSAELLAKDPENRWLARGARFRLPVESIRDQALAASGLWVSTLGGPSVRPYHPPGLYEQVVAGSSADTYVQDTGAGLYRRTLYTYWKRSVPNPALLVFDMPFRETCTVRRARTSTPLQALNLLNDPTYVEASRALAEQVLTGPDGSPEARIRDAFRRVLARDPLPRELKVLHSGWQRSLADFQADPEAAMALVKVGNSPARPGLDPAELAAFTLLASTLFNLDETVTRP